MGSDSYHEQLKRNSKFLCLDQRMHTELVGRLVLQLNRTNPQILTDKEAQRFRNLSVPTAVRLAELLVYLQGKGEEEFHEFYRGLQIHTDKFYFNPPTRVSRRRGTARRGNVCVIFFFSLSLSLSLSGCLSLSVFLSLSFSNCLSSSFCLFPAVVCLLFLCDAVETD
uniref:CARD domain-containing protein n=1 Tax=Oncorhynchus mykiss TaxID=8022 RepID=A0A8C7SZP7_ONCMY